MLKLATPRTRRPPRTALRHIAVEFEVPEEVFQTLKGEKGVARHIRERITMDLVDAGLISRGRAGEMLGLDPFETADLMNHSNVPYFTIDSVKDFAKSLEVARSLNPDPSA